MKLIDKDVLVAEIERWIELLTNEKKQEGASQIDKLSLGGRIAELQEVRAFLDTLEVKEVIAEQECTCHETLNRIIGGSWNILCPVNKLGLKNGDIVKVIIEAQKL